MGKRKDMIHPRFLGEYARVLTFNCSFPVHPVYISLRRGGWKTNSSNVSLGPFQQCSVIYVYVSAAAATRAAVAEAEGQRGEGEREREREDWRREGGGDKGRRRKDAAATADLNKIGMTITHEGRIHSLSVLPLTHTHTYKKPVTRLPITTLTHTAVSALIG